jgi:hypothetical protein
MNWFRRQNAVTLAVYALAWVTWKACALGIIVAIWAWIAQQVGG